jgi:transposase
MNAYSVDLRLRVIGYIESGHSRNEASSLFGVSIRSICRWMKLKQETGNLNARHVPRSPHKLPNQELLEYVKANPDRYLREIADHFKCGISSVFDALKRLGITLKKNSTYIRREMKKNGKDS